MSIYHLLRRCNKSSIEDGTEAHPFLIKDVFDFIEFKNELIAGNTFNGIHHKVTNDLDFTGITIPTGINTVYSGTFNGNFKTFKNITSSMSSSGTDFPSVFARIDGGIVENLRFANVNITFTNSNNCSGIFGTITNGIVRKVSIEGNFSFPLRRGSAFGALQSPNSLIENCSYMGTMNKVGGYGVAGISASYEGFNPPYGICSKCINQGTVDAGNDTAKGIASFVNTVIDCVNIGNITGTYGSGSQTKRIQYGALNTINCYSLDTALINGAIPTTEIGQNQNNGANATELQLKSTAFYRDVLGWDMDTVWEIETEGVTFPRLRGFNYNF